MSRLVCGRGCEGGRYSASNGIGGARGQWPRGSFDEEVPTVAHGMRWLGRDGARASARWRCGDRGDGGGVSVVMGLDQHRARISAEWKTASVDSRPCTSRRTQRIPSGMSVPLRRCGPRRSWNLRREHQPRYTGVPATTPKRPVLHSVYSDGPVSEGGDREAIAGEDSRFPRGQEGRNASSDSWYPPKAALGRGPLPRTASDSARGREPRRFRCAGVCCARRGCFWLGAEGDAFRTTCER